MQCASFDVPHLPAEDLMGLVGVTCAASGEMLHQISREPSSKYSYFVHGGGQQPQRVRCSKAFLLLGLQAAVRARADQATHYTCAILGPSGSTVRSDR